MGQYSFNELSNRSLVSGLPYLNECMLRKYLKYDAVNEFKLQRNSFFKMKYIFSLLYAFISLFNF